MLKGLLIIGFISIANFSFSQEHNDYFLKNNGQYVKTIDSADFIRIVSEPDSGSKLYNVLELYKSRKRKLVGQSSQVDPLNFDGQVVAYFEHGHKKSISNYINGWITGFEYKYFPNGKLYMVNEYPDTLTIKGAPTLPHQIKECYDTAGKVLAINGNGYIKIYDDDFGYVYEEGKIKNGVRDSVWKGTDKKLGIHFTEIYKDGELMSGTGVDANGVAITYLKSRETIPLFKNGIDEFFRYMVKRINFPRDVKEKEVAEKGVVKFLISDIGKVSNVSFNKFEYSSFDQEIIKAINSSPVWTPATKFGHKINFIYTLPVNIVAMLSHN